MKQGRTFRRGEQCGKSHDGDPGEVGKMSRDETRFRDACYLFGMEGVSAALRIDT